MESMSTLNRELVSHTLQQIETAIHDLKRWNKDVNDMDDLAKSSEGMQRLAGNCMLIQAIGEGFKQIDKRTDGQLLPMRPEIPWRQVKGMRDRISHGYFDLDTEYINDVIQNDLDPLLEAVQFFLKELAP